MVHQKKFYSTSPKEGHKFVTCRTGNPISSDGYMSLPAPVLHNKMTMKMLEAFIQSKRQESLQRVDDPDIKEAYIFWELMYLFCNINRKVQKADIANCLIKAYSCLTKKAPRVVCDTIENDWCLALAKILCSATPDKQLRHNIILMADDLACSGRLFASHICCVVVQLELGSYTDSSFDLIGCDRFPTDQRAIRETMERTEVYEFALFLISGATQASLQKYKARYAELLFRAGYSTLAFDYCETVAEEIVKSPSSFDVSLMQQIIVLSEQLLPCTAVKPKWLQTLCKSPQARLARALGSRYKIGKLLGKGGFGSVYAGVRKADGTKVAIKYITKSATDEYIRIPGETERLPIEVALMKLVSVPPVCQNIVQLLEWMELPTCFVLVLERPSPCMDLGAFYELHNGRLPESLAQTIMRQVVQAVRHCFERGVFHSDIKEENLLINPDTLEVKLIDFGCGTFLTNSIYKNIAGTQAYWPPEWILHRGYMGRPATVWSLGVLMHSLVTGNLPFENDQEIAHGQLRPRSDLSLGCQQLIQRCLEKNPSRRATIEDINSDEWLRRDL